MFSVDRKRFWLVGLNAAAGTFVLLFAGMKMFAVTAIAMQNIVAYVIFSLIVGAVAALLVYFRLTIAFLCYVAGLVLGFMLMFRAFIFDKSGWGDLIGIVSLMMWLLIGLGAGFLLQLVRHLYKRYKK